MTLKPRCPMAFRTTARVRGAASYRLIRPFQNRSIFRTCKLPHHSSLRAPLHDLIPSGQRLGSDEPGNVYGADACA